MLDGHFFKLMAVICICVLYIHVTFPCVDHKHKYKCIWNDIRKQPDLFCLICSYFHFEADHQPSVSDYCVDFHVTSIIRVSPGKCQTSAVHDEDGCLAEVFGCVVMSINAATDYQ